MKKVVYLRYSSYCMCWKNRNMCRSVVFRATSCFVSTKGASWGLCVYVEAFHGRPNGNTDPFWGEPSNKTSHRLISFASRPSFATWVDLDAHALKVARSRSSEFRDCRVSLVRANVGPPIDKPLVLLHNRVRVPRMR